MQDSLFQLASRILVVDDEVHIARFLEFLLNREGYQTAIAHDGLEALERYHTFKPDGILLDLLLPKLSGLDVLRRIHEETEPDARAPFILLLTGMNLQDIPIDIMKLGTIAHCPKPVAPSTLIRMLQKHGLYGYSRPQASFAQSRAAF
jgi:CheY-like chemotaxis protein